MKKEYEKAMKSEMKAKRRKEIARNEMKMKKANACGENQIENM
jgi:hypothetical protein